MLRSIRFWIGIIITCILLFLFVYQIRGYIGEMGQALKEAQYVFLVPALLVYMAGVFMRAVRWQFLLRPVGHFSCFRLFPLIVIGMLVNNILPARLGILARAYILGEREGVSKMATGGTMVVELVLDGITLLIFAAAVSFFAPLGGLLQQVVNIAAGLFLAVMVLCFLLALSPRLSRMAVGLFVRFLPIRWRGRAEQWLLLLIQGLGIMRSPWMLVVVLAMSGLVWAFEAATYYVIAFCFDLQLPFYAFLLATAVANLAWALLMTQGGLGSFDLACQKAIQLFNIGAAMAASYVVVVHAFILLATIPLGLVFLSLENISLARIVTGRPKQEKG